MDFGGQWDDQLPFVEFAYSNNYHFRIGMTPYEALYGRKYRSPCKSYADPKREDVKFIVRDYVFLKVSTMKGVMRLKKKGKSVPQYVGPLEIKGKIGVVAYRLELPSEFSYLVFHISMLRKYISDPSQILQLEPVEINENLFYEEQPVAIMDH
ncbi:uncharacterized protein LOC122723270 [Manihot esculenta]|uniref:uncharacterized protein LOC122723270 n=1 Tax=Manihot esculenta TaxID=3983 RepID=UPI001CC68177|nr:uncharacterized protein LOC122723270 [Manihot esculenta]